MVESVVEAAAQDIANAVTLEEADEEAAEVGKLEIPEIYTKISGMKLYTDQEQKMLSWKNKNKVFDL